MLQMFDTDEENVICSLCRVWSRKDCRGNSTMTCIVELLIEQMNRYTKSWLQSTFISTRNVESCDINNVASSETSESLELFESVESLEFSDDSDVIDWFDNCFAMKFLYDEIFEFKSKWHFEEDDWL